MYSEEFDDNESELQTSENFFVNFYYNNKILVWIFLGIILFIILISILSKGSGSSKSNKYIVEMIPEGTVTIPLGYSQQFSADVKDYPREKVTISVEDENIAKADNGNVVALNYGKTKVIATYIDSKEKKYTTECELIVADGDTSQKLVNVAFKEGDLFMPVNETYQIALVLTPSRGYVHNKEYTSSNERVVTVDNTGLVTSVGEGEATISVNVNDGQFRKELKVYVSRDFTKNEIIVTPTKITFDGELRKVKVGSNEKLSYTVTPENADQEKLTWKSDDESVVTVDGGRINAIKEGHARITVSSINGQSAVIDIEVESDVVAVTDISLSSTDIYLTAGQSQTITPTISPDNASNKALSYTSMDSSVAMVVPNDTGTSATITGLNAGSTTIAIASVDGKVEKRINVTVTGSQSSNNNNGGSSGGGNSATIKVRINGDMPDKSCNGQSLKFYSNPNVTITLNGGIGEVKYCYSTSICTPSTSAKSNTSFTISGSGLYILRIKKFDKSGNEIASSDSGNYYDGALEYYINTKGDGVTCTRASSSSTTTSSSNWFTISGTLFDSMTTAKNSPATSRTITIKAKDADKLKVCYHKTTDSNSTCNETLSFSRTFNTDGEYILNIYAYSNNKLMKSETKYLYIKTTTASTTSTSCDSGRYTCVMQYNPSSNQIIIMGSTSKSGVNVAKTVIEGRETSSYTPTRDGSFAGTCYFSDGNSCRAENISIQRTSGSTTTSGTNGSTISSGLSGSNNSSGSTTTSGSNNSSGTVGSTISASTPCRNIGKAEDCNKRSDCEWDYTNYCHDKTSSTTTYKCYLVYNNARNVITMNATASNGATVTQRYINNSKISSSEYTPSSSGDYSGSVYFSDGHRESCDKITITVSKTAPTPLNQCCYRDNTGKYVYSTDASVCERYGGFFSTKSNCELYNR